jgi:hypothetical protein
MASLSQLYPTRRSPVPKTLRDAETFPYCVLKFIKR